jgi:hypothetical protein
MVSAPCGKANTCTCAWNPQAAGAVSFRRGPAIVAALSVETRPQQDQQQQQESTVSSSSTEQQGTAPVQQQKKENLKSTAEHRLWTYGCMALMGGAFAQGINHIQGPGDVVGVAAALAAAYVLSDLGTGIYHWFVDNYGDGNTPVFGRQIAAFQVGPCLPAPLGMQSPTLWGFGCQLVGECILGWHQCGHVATLHALPALRRATINGPGRSPCASLPTMSTR